MKVPCLFCEEELEPQPVNAKNVFRGYCKKCDIVWRFSAHGKYHNEIPDYRNPSVQIDGFKRTNFKKKASIEVDTLMG